jgi:hypothetical protein
MARISTTPDVILARIKARLIDQVDGATAHTCWITDDPDAVPAPAPAKQWYVVAPATEGTFRAGEFDGGGQNQMTVDTRIAITVHNIEMLDQVGRSEVWYGGRGILPAGLPVLKAIAGYDLTDASGNQILAQPIFPASFNMERDTKNKRGSLMLTFDIVFDWDMS